MQRLFFIALFLFLLIGCSKSTVLDEAPSLVGVWKHYTAEDAWEIIRIDQDGEGKIEWYTNNKLHKETKVKSWYVKDNTLYLGKVTFSLEPYDITEYPQTAGQEVIINFDTLKANHRYVYLNDAPYVEMD